MFYCNIILVIYEVCMFGDLFMECWICFLVCWNVLVMVMWVNKYDLDLGGYIFIFVFLVIFYDIGFNYFFQVFIDEYGGDLVFFQGYVFFGVYVCVFFEGCISEE